MAIGIIANPASGKDIRRLVSHATVIDNNEKLNIVKRAVLAAHAMGVHDFLIMPDNFMLGQTLCAMVREENDINAKLLDMTTTDSANDTTTAAQLMEDAHAGCVIVLGGDGTSRAAAKVLRDTPILPISTGTNNVYPAMTEGTVAGLCAAAMDLLKDRTHCCIKDKRIEILVDGTFRDIALVDAIVSTHANVGARAIWNMDEIICVVAARAHPQNIGFSSIVGCMQTVLPEDDCCYFVQLSDNGVPVMAPIAPGMVAQLRAETPIRIALNDDYLYHAAEDCMIALDGEREVRVLKGQTITFRLTRNGPWRVNVRETMEFAQMEAFFRRKS